MCLMAGRNEERGLEWQVACIWWATWGEGDVDGGRPQHMGAGRLEDSVVQEDTHVVEDRDGWEAQAQEGPPEMPHTVFQRSSDRRLSLSHPPKPFHHKKVKY